MSIRNIGVIGAGHMGGSFIRGWLRSEPDMAARITVTDAVPAFASKLAEDTGVRLAATNPDLVEMSDLVLLAVKPADVDDALMETVAQFGRGRIIASIVAGRTLASLEVLFPVEVPVIRLMPNVAVGVNAGTICMASGKFVDLETEEEAAELFGRLGRVIILNEKLFSAATALSGSGPGFLALIIDAFIDAGVMAGLSSATARELAYSMMEGTAQLLMTNNISPGELRRMVTSPAGTTAAGIAQMERDGVRSAIIDAVQAAVRRAGELG